MDEAGCGELGGGRGGGGGGEGGGGGNGEGQDWQIASPFPQVLPEPGRMPQRQVEMERQLPGRT